MKRITILVLSIALVLVGNAWAETLFVAGGAADQSVPITIVDSTTGLAETGVTSASAGLALWYWRIGSTKTDLTEGDLASLDAAHEAAVGECDLYEVGDGVYRMDLPDAAVAAGVPWVKIGGTVTGMVVYGPTVMISAPIGAAASVTGAVGSVTGAVGSVTGAVGSVTGAVGSVTDPVTLANGAHGGAAATLVLSDYANFKADVTNLDVAVSSRAIAGDAMTLADDAITASKYDETTTWGLTAADTGATQVARVGADADTLETISDQIDGVAVPGSAMTLANGAIKAVTYDGTTVEAITPARGAAIDDLIDGGRTDLLIDSILADTDEVQAEFVDGGRTDLLIDAIKVGTDRVTAARATIIDDWGEDGRLDTIIDSILSDTGELQAELVDGGRTDLLIDAILADTNELEVDWKNGGRLDLLIDAILEDTGTTIPGLFKYIPHNMWR